MSSPAAEPKRRHLSDASTPLALAGAAAAPEPAVAARLDLVELEGRADRDRPLQFEPEKCERCAPQPQPQLLSVSPPPWHAQARLSLCPPRFEDSR